MTDDDSPMWVPPEVFRRAPKWDLGAYGLMCWVDGDGGAVFVSIAENPNEQIFPPLPDYPAAPTEIRFYPDAIIPCIHYDLPDPPAAPDGDGGCGCPQSTSGVPGACSECGAWVTEGEDYPE